MSKKRKKNETKETKVEDTSDSNQEIKTGDDKEKIPKIKPESLMRDWKKKTLHFRRNMYEDCDLFA